MAHLLVHHKVEDYNKWKSLFDQHSIMRGEMGSKGGKVLRSVKDPNELFVLLEWDSVENAQKFSQSDNLKSVMQEAGVMGVPEIYFVEEIATADK